MAQTYKIKNTVNDALSQIGLAPKTTPTQSQYQPNQQGDPTRPFYAPGAPISNNQTAQPAISQPAISQPAPPTTPQNIHTTFNTDGTVTVTDKNGQSQTYNHKDYMNQLDMPSSNVRTALHASDLAKGLVAPTQQEQKQIDAQKAQDVQTAQQTNLGLINQKSQNLQPNVEMNPTPQILGQAQQALIKGVGGAITGGVVGAVAGGGALSPITATGGAVLGGIAGAGSELFNYLPALKEQYAQEVNKNIVDLSTAKRTLATIINQQKLDPSNAGQHLQDFNQALTRIDQAEANIKKLNENEWLAKAKPELERFNVFNQPSGQRDYYSQQMALALANPDPKKLLSTSDIGDNSAT